MLCLANPSPLLVSSIVRHQSYRGSRIRSKILKKKMEYRAAIVATSGKVFAFIPATIHLANTKEAIRSGNFTLYHEKGEHFLKRLHRALRDYARPTPGHLNMHSGWIRERSAP